MFFQSKMKSKLRNIHIDKEIWKWVVQPDRFGAASEVRIYSPNKKLYRVNPSDLITKTMYVGIEGDLPTGITPSNVKNYIIKNIKNEEKQKE